jgi:hypothetical protein
MAKAAKLSSLAHPKPGTDAMKAAEAGPDDYRIKGQTVRLTIPAWQQLKLLAIQEGKTSHALIIEALNLLFDKHRKPPLA